MSATKNENGTHTVKNGFGVWIIDDKRREQSTAADTRTWADAHGLIVSVPTLTGPGCLVSKRDGCSFPIPHDAPAFVRAHLEAR